MAIIETECGLDVPSSRELATILPVWSVTYAYYVSTQHDVCGQSSQLG